MTPRPNETGPSRPVPAIHSVRFGPASADPGPIDWMWWPHGDVPATALPDLRAMLALRLRPTQRVAYNLGEWETAPRKLDIGGRHGYRHNTGTLDARAVGGTKLTIRIVTAADDSEMVVAQQRWDDEGGAAG